MVAAEVAVVAEKDGDLAKAIHGGQAANRKFNLFIHHMVTLKLIQFFE